MASTLALFINLIFLACGVAFFGVAMTLWRANQDAPPERRAGLMSIFTWIGLSVLGVVLWAFVIGILTGFGYRHGGSLGLFDIVGTILVLAGPFLYIYSAYRIVQRTNRILAASDN